LIIDNAKLENEKRNVIKEKSFAFAIEIVFLYKVLAERKEFILSKQLLRSGTSIGANIRESEHGQSKADLFTNYLLP
jgi:four helix bundle protein